MFSVTVLVFGWILTVVKGCDEESVYEALQACQYQREDLSSASGSSFSGNKGNYTELCFAFRNYVNCMDPRIGNCNGTATSAFKIIKDTYSADPYSCTSSHEQVKTVEPNQDMNIPPKPTEEDNNKSKDQTVIGSSANSNCYLYTLLLIFIMYQLLL